MANKIKGEASFTIGGTEYTICFNNDALIQLEDKLDRGIVAITSEMQRWSAEPERLRLKWVRALLWAGLRKHHPTMTVEQTSELIDQSNGAEMMNVIGDAMQKAFADTESKGARPMNGTSSTGTGQGSSQISSLSDSESKPSGISHPTN